MRRFQDACKMPKLACPTTDESLSSADESPSRHSLPALPEEIISEILPRVSVRSLLKFRCVCKSWCSQISTPQFARKHLRTLIATDPNKLCQRLICSIIGDPKIISFPVQPLFQNPSAPAKVRRLRTSDKYHILGSCNGLLCLCDIHQRFVRLWNPSIRVRSKRLNIDVGSVAGITFHGFGYDHVNNKYKLFVVVEDISETVTKVYTFGANSWKVIQNFPHRPTRWLGKFVSGTNTLNWTAKGGVSGDQWLILSLDLENESYGEMLLPQGESDKVCNPVLNVLRNCLCVCFYDSEKACWVVWLMKEYGVQCSWTILVMIPHFIKDPWTEFHLGVFRWYHSLEPLCISEDGVVILKTNFNRVVLYNPNDGALDYATISDEHGLHDLHDYHESLISPPC